MSPAQLKLLSFSMGLLLAVALGLATRPSSTALARTGPSVISPAVATNSEIVESITKSAQQLDRSPKNKPGPQAAAKSVEASLPREDESAAPKHSLTELEQLDPQKRISLLIHAMREGSIGSLQDLQTKQISFLPNYRDTILPRLRAEGLEAMLGRFRQIDWLNWSLSSFAVDGGPTEARLFVDRVTAVNPELGSFLDTAAELCHALFLATKQGEVFSSQDHLNAMLQSAERAESDPKRGPAALSRNSIDSQILQNPVFTDRFESLRVQFVVDYVEAHPSETLSSFSLLLSSPPSIQSDIVVEALLMLLRRFTLEASPKFREQVFDIVHRSLNLQLLAKREQPLRRALAELYLVGAMDSLQQEDRRKAAVYLDESQTFTSGLKGQEILSEYLKSNARPAKAASPPEPETAKAETKAEPAAHAAESERPSLLSRITEPKADPDQQSKIRTTLASGISYLSMLLFALLVGGGIFLVVIYRRSLQTLSGINLPHPSSGEKNGSSMRMTSPNEMDFGEEFELGSKSKQSPF